MTRRTFIRDHAAPAARLVRKDLIPDHPSAEFSVHDVCPFDPASVGHSGALTSGAGASEAKGRAVVENLVPALATQIAAAFGLPAPQ